MHESPTKFRGTRARRALELFVRILAIAAIESRMSNFHIYLTMKSGVTLRVARPTDHLAGIAEMYMNGLGFVVLAQFADHAGFDGIVLGHPGAPYHLEFTAQRGHPVGTPPMKDHLLAFYIPNADEWEQSCAEMRSAGFKHVPSYNPYWDMSGRTFEDLDGFRVVLQNTEWEP
jgi:hypothetical protein